MQDMKWFVQAKEKAARPRIFNQIGLVLVGEVKKHSRSTLPESSPETRSFVPSPVWSPRCAILSLVRSAFGNRSVMMMMMIILLLLYSFNGAGCNVSEQVTR